MDRLDHAQWGQELTLFNQVGLQESEADPQESHEIDEISGASMAKINQMADAAQSKAGKIASDLKSAFGGEFSWSSLTRP